MLVHTNTESLSTTAADAAAKLFTIGGGDGLWHSPFRRSMINFGTGISLYNAFTETLKGGLLKLPFRSDALHGVLDTAAGRTQQAHKSAVVFEC